MSFFVSFTGSKENQFVGVLRSVVGFVDADGCNREMDETSKESLVWKMSECRCLLPNQRNNAVGAATSIFPSHGYARHLVKNRPWNWDRHP